MILDVALVQALEIVNEALMTIINNISKSVFSVADKDIQRMRIVNLP